MESRECTSRVRRNDLLLDNGGLCASLRVSSKSRAEPTPFGESPLSRNSRPCPKDGRSESRDPRNRLETREAAEAVPWHLSLRNCLLNHENRPFTITRETCRQNLQNLVKARNNGRPLVLPLNPRSPTLPSICKPRVLHLAVHLFRFHFRVNTSTPRGSFPTRAESSLIEHAILLLENVSTFFRLDLNEISSIRFEASERKR